MTEVQRLLDDLVASGEEIGAQVAAHLDGELVIDAWAGTADVATGTPVDGDTLFHSYSTGKGMAATVVAWLVDRGLLEYDAPVARYWPEFGVRGKERTTVGHVLSHTAGLPYVRPDLSPEELFDTPAMVAWLADQEPVWEPGTMTGYQGWTYGFLVAEIVRRASGRTIDEILHSEIATPLGMPGALLFSVPDDAAVATLFPGTWENWLDSMPDDSPFFKIAPRAVVPSAKLGNRRDYLRSGIPASGTLSARAGSRMYAALMAGELVSEKTLKLATAVRTTDTDVVLGLPGAKANGFFLGRPGVEGPGPLGLFGMGGSGGSIACADPDHRFAFAFTHNRMTDQATDAAGRVERTVRAVLGLPA